MPEARADLTVRRRQFVERCGVINGLEDRRAHMPPERSRKANGVALPASMHRSGDSE
jgi:hypothetical protein